MPSNADLRGQLEALGLDPNKSTPQALRERIRNKHARGTKVNKEAGITAS